MTDAKPNRRWFRFRLRTLFVLVSIASVPLGWVAYQLNWIRQRHRFLQRHQQPDYELLVTDDEARARTDRFPWPLRLFGEQEKWAVHAPANEADEAAKLFPEADVDSR
jgi:hypothetical protein